MSDNEAEGTIQHEHQEEAMEDTCDDPLPPCEGNTEDDPCKMTDSQYEEYRETTTIMTTLLQWGSILGAGIVLVVYAFYRDNRDIKRERGKQRDFDFGKPKDQPHESNQG